MIHDMLFPLGNNIHFYDHFSDEDKSIETLLQESMDFIQEKFTNDETVKNYLGKDKTRITNLLFVPW